MRAELIAVGTEILTGQIVNTNAQFLSEKFAENGIDVFFQTAVGDNEK
ncbi:molybdopterin-binding protein, partial [Streptococcus pyogenes]